jgi:hypothetical protein
MDHQSFITLSKFTVEARKTIGTVNPSRLMKDEDYSAAVFKKVAATDHDELKALAHLLKTQLGLVKEAKPAAPVKQEKYLYGARG